MRRVHCSPAPEREPWEAADPAQLMQAALLWVPSPAAFSQHASLQDRQWQWAVSEQTEPERCIPAGKPQGIRECCLFPWEAMHPWISSSVSVSGNSRAGQHMQAQGSISPSSCFLMLLKPWLMEPAGQSPSLLQWNGSSRKGEMKLCVPSINLKKNTLVPISEWAHHVTSRTGSFWRTRDISLFWVQQRVWKASTQSTWRWLLYSAQLEGWGQTTGGCDKGQGGEGLLRITAFTASMLEMSGFSAATQGEVLFIFCETRENSWQEKE